MQSDPAHPPTNGTPPDKSAWPVVVGTGLIVAWIAVAVLLFYTIAVSGLLVEIFVAIIRPILFPGTSGSQPDMLTWLPSMRVGLILAGAAGIPAGLSIFWRNRRTGLLGSFAILLLAGLLCGLYSLWTMIAGFSG